MPKSDKPKVPRTTRRSAGDTGTPQRGEANGGEAGDDPRRAAESGEQGETGRSRGRVIDESGEPVGKPPQKGNPAKGEHWESGRHEAQ